MPEWSARSRQPLHRKPQSVAPRVDHWAAAQPPVAWQRLTLREGEKGLLVDVDALGFGMVKKSRHAVGISWCVGIRSTTPISFFVNKKIFSLL
jgi:hypothetical protein